MLRSSTTSSRAMLGLIAELPEQKDRLLVLFYVRESDSESLAAALIGQDAADIQDIAQAAGVSVGKVSRLLHAVSPNAELRDVVGECSSGNCADQVAKLDCQLRRMSIRKSGKHRLLAVFDRFGVSSTPLRKQDLGVNLDFHGISQYARENLEVNGSM